MASTNKTERLGLNQWLETDRPQRGDFNSDNLILEEVVASHTEDSSIHLTSAEKSKVKVPFATMVYLGDGNTQQRITMPFVASLYFVFADGMPMSVYDSTLDCTRVYAGCTGTGSAGSSGVGISDGMLTVSSDAEAESGIMNCLNELNRQYTVVAVK